MTACLVRPLRLQTARELAFLLLGGLTAIVGFVVQVTGLSVGLSLLITFVGIPILLALAVADRWLCIVVRWRVGFVRRGRPRRVSQAAPARLRGVDEDGRDRSADVEGLRLGMAEHRARPRLGGRRAVAADSWGAGSRS